MARYRQSTQHRGYSYMPSQQQVVETFATPFHEFLRTLSRIARIITLYGLSAVTAVALVYEGTHQYVEHVAMKKSFVKSSFNKDQWGWDDEVEDETWGRTAGSDRRLGFLGRHALRSAWMALNWGGGVSLSHVMRGSVFGSPKDGMFRGITPSGTSSIVQGADGLGPAEQFLARTLEIAEAKGIKLPDIAAVRAGLISPAQAGLDAPLDLTAVALETKLAGIRERLGSPASLPLAVAGYERVYDALSATQHTQDLVKGTKFGQPQVPLSRLVRLATKLGDLNASIGRREEAEAWLLKAVSLAGGQGSGESDNPDDAQRRSSLLPEATQDGGSSKKTDSHWYSGLTGSTRQEPAASQEPPAPVTASLADSTHSQDSITAVVPVVPTPTPALTRSLLSALLSMSGLYAAPPSPAATSPKDPAWKANLEQALQVQASVLGLLRLEVERVARAEGHTELGAQLHSLWLQHHQAMASVHVAETIYALDRSDSSSKGLRAAVGKLIPSSSAKEGKYAQSLHWLSQADVHATLVEATLKGNKASEPSSVALLSELLKDKWKQDMSIELPASRLLRDARRIKKEAQGMAATLEKKK